MVSDPPCSDSDESDDDVLSVGPMRPLVTAAPLGGARGHDDDMIQTDSLRDEWLVDSWTVGDRYGTGCAQLDNFDWVMPTGYLVGVLPTPEEDDSLSDVEPDVCDVPDVFPIASVYADRDWVTPLRISPQTCTGLFLFGRCSFLGGLTNSRTSQLVDGGPVSVGKTCMPTFL